jgi:hypothetical protein
MDPPNIDGLAWQSASASNIKKREGEPNAAVQHIEWTVELEMNQILVHFTINRFSVIH